MSFVLTIRAPECMILSNIFTAHRLLVVMQGAPDIF